MRLKRDRVAVASAWVLGIFGALVILAPLIQALYGDDPELGHSELLDSIGYPIGTGGGISSSHWLGLTPAVGQDLFLQVIFGARTSLGIALIATVLGVALGVVIGVASGFAGGWVDRTLVWFTDFMLAFPFYLFAIALVPIVNTLLADQYGAVADWKRIIVIISVFVDFRLDVHDPPGSGSGHFLAGTGVRRSGQGGWCGYGAHAVPADPARTSGPRSWSTFSLSVPATVTLEAALSFLNVGVVGTDPRPRAADPDRAPAT